MRTFELGQSGIEATRIGLGTNYVGGHNLYENVDESEGVRLVQHAIDAGVTFIDTADVYGTGRSEELVGKAIAGRRDQVVLATKGGIRFGDAGTGVSNSPGYLRAALEASLRRLAVDTVDLYYIHRPDGETPPEEAFGTLMRFKEEGLIRAAGVSNFERDDLEAAAKAGPIDALQSRFNLLQREPEATVLPFCEANRVSFIPWGPLAYGLLGGRYRKDFELPPGDWRHRSGAFDPEVYSRNIDVVERLKLLAEEVGVPVAHVAVQWLLSRPAVDSVITGAKSADQVEDNVRADAVELSAPVLARIAELAG